MFLGNDRNALNDVLHTFILDTQQNCKHLKKAADSYDISQLNNTSHKMLPMFRQLEVHTAIPILETFEKLSVEDYSVEQLKKEAEDLQLHIKKLLETISLEVTTHPNRNS